MSDLVFIDVRRYATTGQTGYSRERIPVTTTGLAALTDLCANGAAPGAPANLDAAWPIGCGFIAFVPTNPATLLGFGTWVSAGTGRMLVGIDPADPDFDTVRKTGGAKTVTLTEAQMPAHTHVQNAHTHAQDAHSHLTQRYPTATGALSGFTIDTSMSGTPANNTLPTAAATAVNQNATAVNQNTGGGQAHPNLPPYIVIYLWERTA